jgi:hypothetical protein
VELRGVCGGETVRPLYERRFASRRSLDAVGTTALVLSGVEGGCPACEQPWRTIALIEPLNSILLVSRPQGWRPDHPITCSGNRCTL